MDEIIIEESGSVEVVEINSGWQGPIGYTGSAGIQGEKGQDGIQGPIGYTGSAGNIGYTGSQGPIGLTGYTGSQGISGTAGPTGYTGSKGDTGLQGIIGYTGSAGSQGLQGVIGYTGSAGSQGSIGYTGSQGDTGLQGEQGPQGYTGSAGIDGLPGVQGPQGLIGPIGYTGSAGSGGIADISQDTTPQLGGDLNVSDFAIVSESNKSIVISPNGTGKTVVKNINYDEMPFDLPYSATLTPDVLNGTVQIVSLTGNVVFSNFANAIPGQSLTLIVKQDSVGSRTLTSTMKFAGGFKTLSVSANAVDIISVFFDGANYWASLARGFA